jgi:hypothetical protein
MKDQHQLILPARVNKPNRTRIHSAGLRRDIAATGTVLLLTALAATLYALLFILTA